MERVTVSNDPDLAPSSQGDDHDGLPGLDGAREGRVEESHAVSLVDLEPVALEATRVAALACQAWVGRGRPDDADEAATEAMRSTLARAPRPGTVIVGEGAKDKAPMLFVGEKLGAEDGPGFDIAVDPLECTKLCARGLPGSLTTIAVSEPGTMATLGAAFYMDKLVGPAACRGALDLAQPVEDNLASAGEALKKPVSELRVVLLDKPRHEELHERILRAGATVILLPDGDVAGALATLLPGAEADLLVGIGGTPEGIMTACAAQALDGFMQARLAPQSEDEERALDEADLSSERIYELDELAGGESFFAATGVTGGTLLRQPWEADGCVYTESLLIAAGSVRKLIEGRRSARQAPPAPDSQPQTTERET